ncbi:hypothetical protein HPB47_018624 [Ixodes persulcatus]|uniref:Uncharacterized protein n=1 Tax=Ixodes persulcatus TaxID=34615 RepID=A0AC60QK86_IXOPE|nr:hypothetical protein HPB47_018624 [Ixodes persulcatus]
MLDARKGNGVDGADDRVEDSWAEITLGPRTYHFMASAHVVRKILQVRGHVLESYLQFSLGTGRISEHRKGPGRALERGVPVGLVPGARVKWLGCPSGPHGKRASSGSANSSEIVLSDVRTSIGRPGPNPGVVVTARKFSSAALRQHSIKAYLQTELDDEEEVTEVTALKKNSDTIRQCVQNKLKKERRPLVSVQEVADYREKFGTKGRGRKRSTDLDIVGPCAKARRRGFVDTEKCEDAESVRRHVLLMKEESTKVPLNVDLLQDRMMRTFQSRQELILSEAGVRTVLQEFPAVRIPGMLLQDVKLSFGKDILEDMKAKMEAFTASTLVFLKGKNVLLNFEELLEGSPDTDATNPSRGK